MSIYYTNSPNPLYFTVLATLFSQVYRKIPANLQKIFRCTLNFIKNYYFHSITNAYFGLSIAHERGD